MRLSYIIEASFRRCIMKISKKAGKTGRRFTALALVLAMAFALTACGKKADNEDQRNQTAKDYVYVAEYKTLESSDDYNISMYDASISGGKVLIQASKWDEETQIYSAKLILMDAETMEMTDIPVALGANESFSYQTLTPDGNIMLLINSWDESDGGKQSYALATLDTSGAELSRVDITASFREAVGGEAWPQDMNVDGDGNVYIRLSGDMDEKVLVLNAQGQKLFDVGGDMWYLDMCQSADGRIFLLTDDDSAEGRGGYMLRPVDVKAKAFGESLRGIPRSNGQMMCVAGGENEMLIASGNVLYSYSLTDQTYEEILNWIDSDINSDSIRLFTRLQDGRVLVFDHMADGEAEAIYLTKTAASEVAQKETLTFGTMQLDSRLRDQVIQFNKTNDAYRVEVKEYGSGDYEAGMTQFNNDITSGSGPDIIDLNAGNMDTYISKGVLTDLYPLMEAAGGIQKDDLMANVLEAYERDGRLYGLATCFTVETLMGKKSDLGDRTGWTIADVKALLESKPEGTELMSYATRENILGSFLVMNFDSFVDWSSGECSFDSDTFVELLEFANSFPSYEDMNVDYENQESEYVRLSGGKVLLTSLYLSSVAEYQFRAAMYGEPVTCIGYPTPDGTCGSVLSADIALGISEKSAHKEGAWQFLSSLLSEDYDEGDHIWWGFPVVKSALDQMLAASMDEERNGSGSFMSDDFSWDTKAATQEEVDAVRAVLESAKGGTAYNEEIFNIINEDAAPYFNGQKTAKEVAEIIQSRVKLYVSENS